jgi:hypothetical protein
LRYAGHSHDKICHCERSEAIQRLMHAAPGLLRRSAPRNGDSIYSRVMPGFVPGIHVFALALA